MTIASIADSVEFKTQLKQALEHPAIGLALSALEQENMPELNIKAPAAGMSIMEAIALDAAKRAGAQSIIKRLKRLPFLTKGALSTARSVGGSWEYLADSPQDQTQNTNKTKS
jgi:hypothetical protein